MCVLCKLYNFGCHSLKQSAKEDFSYLGDCSHDKFCCIIEKWICHYKYANEICGNNPVIFLLPKVMYKNKLTRCMDNKRYYSQLKQVVEFKKYIAIAAEVKSDWHL